MRILFLLITAVLLASCKTTEYVPIETVKTEYRDRYVERTDTVRITDSTFVYVKGDTTYIYKYRDRWRDRVVMDTAFITRTDSVEVPIPVERELTFWEKCQMESWKFLFMFLLIYKCFNLIKRKWFCIRNEC